jgi:hypothetical protein
LNGEHGLRAFASRVVTDGVSVNFIFARRMSSGDSISGVELLFEDFTDREVETHFQPIAVDPGRTQVFTASYGSGPTPHEVRRCSSKEYYSMAGSTRRNAELQRQKHQIGLDTVETLFPTAKTADIRQYDRYITYLLNHYDTLANFYDISTAQVTFQNYQGKQRARQEMAAILIHGGPNYNATKRRNTRKIENVVKKKEYNF